MKKSFIYTLLPAFIFACVAIGFTVCSGDDEEEIVTYKWIVKGNGQVRG